jgi:hypothetical protein
LAITPKILQQNNKISFSSLTEAVGSAKLFPIEICSFDSVPFVGNFCGITVQLSEDSTQLDNPFSESLVCLSSTTALEMKDIVQTPAVIPILSKLDWSYSFTNKLTIRDRFELKISLPDEVLPGMPSSKSKLQI